MKAFEIKRPSSSKTQIYLFGIKILSLKIKKLTPYLALKSAPKFCASYSVFDGEELLEASIKSIRSQVDHINVVYQTTSWFGKPAAPTLLKVLKEIQEKGLIDELIFFEPDLKKNPQTNEREKRNIGLKAAVKAGGNYFMTIDCDEFYHAHELKKAKETILKKGITHAYCSQIFYKDKPTSMQVFSFACYAQIFCRVDRFSLLGDNEYAVCLADPTRMVLERENSKHFVFNNIFTHHMVRVRRDLQKKYQNSSMGLNEMPKFDAKEDMTVEVENYFNIKFDEPFN